MEVIFNHRRTPLTRRRARRAVLLLGALAVLLSASPAHAADRIYWSNLYGDSISWANLDGGGGGDLPINPSAIDGPMGLAIDTPAGKIYWSNYGSGNPGDAGIGDGTSIGVANLDGSDAHIVPIAAGMVSGPHGVAVDAGAGKLYWTDRVNEPSPPSWIGVSNLDGSNAHHLDVGTATLDGPRGLALDLKAQRIYWANYNVNSFAWASLNGGTGGDLNPGNATVQSPEGVALDRAGRLFFGNFPDIGMPDPSETISYINLNGSGGGDLQTPGATRADPHGIAIDTNDHRVYWPNFDTSSISYASIDGSGGADLPTPNATKNGPNLPVLLEAPVPTGHPAIKGSAAPRSRLHCGNGSWAPDQTDTLLYHAPTSYSFSWRKNGKSIAGANGGAFFARKVGEYRCTVSGSNVAGSSTESTLEGTFKIGPEQLNRAKGTATLTVLVPGRGRLSIKGKGLAKGRLPRLERAATGLARQVKKRGKTKLAVKPKGKLKKRLNQKGRVKFKATVVFTPRGGSASTQVRRLKLERR
jgi:hypothetical protein